MQAVQFQYELHQRDGLLHLISEPRSDKPERVGPVSSYFKLKVAESLAVPGSPSPQVYWHFVVRGK